VGDDELLTTQQAIERLGVSRAAFWNIVRREQVQRYRAPADAKRVFFKRSDVERLARPVPAE
jgi:predicted DNA-binding protein (UPF0251 family)